VWKQIRRENIWTEEESKYVSRLEQYCYITGNCRGMQETRNAYREEYGRTTLKCKLGRQVVRIEIPMAGFGIN
jgi:hypothetical protein